MEATTDGRPRRLPIAPPGPLGRGPQDAPGGRRRRSLRRALKRMAPSVEDDLLQGAGRRGPAGCGPCCGREDGHDQDRTLRSLSFLGDDRMATRGRAASRGWLAPPCPREARPRGCAARRARAARWRPPWTPCQVRSAAEAVVDAARKGCARKARDHRHRAERRGAPGPAQALPPEGRAHLRVRSGAGSGPLVRSRRLPRHERRAVFHHGPHLARLLPDPPRPDRTGLIGGA